jgi:hypothetical protein
MEEEQTKSGFLFRNLLRGLIFFVIIITIFLVTEDFLLDNFKADIDAIQDKPLLIYTIFFASEVLFGLVPPEFFMMVWILHKVTMGDYITMLAGRYQNGQILIQIMIVIILPCFYMPKCLIY